MYCKLLFDDKKKKKMNILTFENQIRNNIP